MDDKKIALIASTVSITALAVVIAAFLWHRSSSEQARVIMENSAVYSPQEDQVAGKSASKESTSAIITDVARTQAPPETKVEGKPENIVHLSLPDPNDAAPDKSAEKFKSDTDDEEDTDDGITVETEPDDE